MAVIGNLLIGIKGNNKDFKKKAVESQSVAKRLKSGLVSAGKVGAAGLGAIAAAASATAFALKSIVDEQAPIIDHLAKFSSQIGLTISELKALQLAAGYNGAETEQMEKALLVLNQRMGDVRTGLVAGAGAFEQLGLTQQQVNSMSTVEGLKAVADGIAALPDPAQRASVAIALFGEEGAKLLTFFQQGSAGIDDIIAKSNELGGSFGALDASKVEMMNDQILTMQTTWTNIKQLLTLELAPIFSSIGSDLTDGLNSGGDAAKTMRGLIEDIAIGASYVGNVFQGLKIAWEFTSLAFTSGIMVIVQALTVPLRLMQKITGTDWGSSMIDFADEFTSVMEEEAHALVDKTKNTEWVSAKTKNFFKEVKAERLAAEKENAKNKGNQPNVDPMQTQATLALTKHIEKLKEQADTYGMTADQMELYKAKSAGVSDELIQQAQALQNNLKSMAANESLDDSINNLKQQIYLVRNDVDQAGIQFADKLSEGGDPFKIKEAIELQKELQKLQDNKSLAQSYKESIKTEAEKMREEMEKIKALFDEGFLNQQEFELAKAKIGEGVDSGTSSPQFAGALVAGTTEARSALLSFRTNNDLPKKSLDEQKKMNRKMDQLIAVSSGGSGLVGLAI